MADHIPCDEELGRALGRMRRRKAPGLSGIRVDHLKDWFVGTYPERSDVDPDPECERCWELVGAIVRDCFEFGVAPSAFLFGTLVIIPKDDKGGVRGIGLLEAIHKLISAVINLRIAEAVTFCPAVHGFRRKRGCFTAIGEAKMRMQRAACRGESLYQIYLDLRKAYDSIDRAAVLALMRRYGVGPNICRYVMAVWEEQAFMLRQSGFFSEPFPVDRGVTQGDVDSPIIFNLIIDAVLRRLHGESEFGGTECGFYADDGLLEHGEPKRLQRDLDRLVDLFAHFGLKANRGKTKYMVIRGPPVPQSQSVATYERVRRGGGPRRRLERAKITCERCGARMQRESLQRHLDTIHNERVERYLCREVATPATFRVRMEGRRTGCPVPGCGGGASDPYGMRRHFAFRHHRAELRIVDEQETTRCLECGMFVVDVERHRGSETCMQLARRRTNERLAQEQAEADTVGFTVNGGAIERVREFRYLGRVLAEDDCDTPCIQVQLQRARRRWRDVARVLKREGANARAMATFYIAIVQAVLLYGADSWTITDRDRGALERFHKRAVRHITGKHIRCDAQGEWTYPDHDALLRTCGLAPMTVYIERRRGTLRSYLQECKTDLFREVQTLRPPARDPQRVLWWKQAWREKGSDESTVM